MFTKNTAYLELGKRGRGGYPILAWATYSPGLLERKLEIKFSVDHLVGVFTNTLGNDAEKVDPEDQA